MKNRRLKTLALSLLALAASGFALGACSSFIGSDGYQIQSATTQTAANGDTILTIVWTDETVTPLTVTIPKGTAGKDGVGIAGIDTSLSDDQTLLTLTIRYTDPLLENLVLSVPLKAGRGIHNLAISKDEAGNTVLVFEYTDGTSSEAITIPKGEDGVGIKEVTVETNEAGSTVTIHYTDPSLPDSVFTVSNGKGILSVRHDESADTDADYAILIEYTDGTFETLLLPKPQSSSWLTGIENPAASLGKDGDFYLNKVNGFVFQKVGGSWQFLLSMKGTGSSVTYTVTFDANGGSIETGNGAKSEVSKDVNYASYVDLDKIPTPTYENHVFEGWYTSKATDPNAGHFTDLTPVFKDMVLYARWSA